MNLEDIVLDKATPSPRQLFAFARLAPDFDATLADAGRIVEAQYRAHPDSADLYTRLALFAGHAPIVPEREADLFERIDRYGASDAAQNRLTARGLFWLAEARRRLAHLLAALRESESRTGLPIRSQWNRLARSLGDPSLLKEPVPILNARLQLASAFDAIILFRELILEDAYAFDPKRTDPFIIDGGANVGMALACFKWRYPASRILAFEPNPALHEICAANIRLNGWRNIDLKPWALAPQAGHVRLSFSAEQPMASTLTSRLETLVSPESLQESTVEARPLAEFLDENVDYLKLDIEGVEASVLAAAETRLRNVRRGFIEYHFSGNAADNRLSAILSLLERNGFVYRILQPPAEILDGTPMPFRIAARAWSCNVYFQTAEPT